VTGVALACEEGYSIVLVEGVSKALKRYSKLMLRRIDWDDGRDDEEEAAAEEGRQPREPNQCVLVWQVRLCRYRGVRERERESGAGPAAARAQPVRAGVAGETVPLQGGQGERERERSRAGSRASPTSACWCGR
jgi:hypothetical protein